MFLFTFVFFFFNFELTNDHILAILLIIILFSHLKIFGLTFCKCICMAPQLKHSQKKKTNNIWKVFATLLISEIIYFIQKQKKKDLKNFTVLNVCTKFKMNAGNVSNWCGRRAHKAVDRILKWNAHTFTRKHSHTLANKKKTEKKKRAQWHNLVLHIPIRRRIPKLWPFFWCLSVANCLRSF